jgi:hypothetical protein
MTFEAFEALFEAELEKAAQYAEKRGGSSVPRNFIIELHGTGYSKEIFDVETAAMALWIDEDSFWVVIDVSVKEISEDVTKVFVRASGHWPVPFEQTFNYASGTGPFKQIEYLGRISGPTNHLSTLDES